MSAVVVRAYRSPSLVLLAMDWAEGESRQDFLGFAIRRSPGFTDFATSAMAASDWLPNRLSFAGPPAEGQPDFSSDGAPVQKFLWWDARLEGVNAGDPLTYEVFPVCGTPQDPQLQEAEGATLVTALPGHRELGIGTWFNRAVMGSQAFSRKLKALGLAPGQKPSAAQALALRTWLANGMETPVPDFIKAAGDSLPGRSTTSPTRFGSCRRCSSRRRQSTPPWSTTPGSRKTTPGTPCRIRTRMRLTRFPA